MNTHFVIGTAGHIDHGKTALIKALTDIECDTSPQEKERGITINPGFAYLQRNDNDYLAFVDVPGHQRFINNMIAGAIGVDFVMLVIAADDGIMPQTREHLQICTMLGITSGIVVINKCDAVDSDLVEMCEMEIQEFVKGTFLENKPIFKVSAKTHKGIPELKAYLIKGDYIVNVKPRKDDFRLNIDRVFNIKGIGAVVTGTVATGKIKTNAELYLLPNNIPCKVKQIQVHGRDVQVAEQGMRVALNIPKLKKEEMNLGDILCELPMEPTSLIDGMLNFIAQDIELKRIFDAVLLVGTKKFNVTVHVLNYREIQQAQEQTAYTEATSSAVPDYENIKKEEIKPLVQIEFNEDWYFFKDDYFILRNTSANRTIGGGQIIDPQPLKHRRPSIKLIEQLRNASKSIDKYIQLKINEQGRLYTKKYFQAVLALNEMDWEQLMVNSPIIYCKNEAVLDQAKVDQYKKSIIKNLTAFNKSNPLSCGGLEQQKLLNFVSTIRFLINPTENESIKLGLLEDMIEDKQIVRNNNLWQLAGYKTEISPTNLIKINTVRTNFKDEHLKGITDADLATEMTLQGIKEQECKNIVKYLILNRELTRINQELYSIRDLTEVKERLVCYLKSHKEGIKMGEFRELANINRKTAFTIFEYYEKTDVVYKVNDIRFLKQ